MTDHEAMLLDVQQNDKTPRLRHVLRPLSPAERRVLIAVAHASAGGPAGATEIAARARMGNRITSTRLTRLKRRGLLDHSGRRWALRDQELATWIRWRRTGRFLPWPFPDPPVRRELGIPQLSKQDANPGLWETVNPLTSGVAAQRRHDHSRLTAALNPYR